MNVFEIRHGETEWSVNGRHTGTTDLAMTDNGRRLADLLRRALSDRVIARTRAVEGDVALFAHGHVLRVLLARWPGSPAGAGRHFRLDTGTLSVLGEYRGNPALESRSAPVGGHVSPATRCRVGRTTP